MPSPQSLVAFMLTLLVLLLAARVQLGLPPLVAAGISCVLALGAGAIAHRYSPLDEEDEPSDDSPVGL